MTSSEGASHSSQPLNTQSPEFLSWISTAQCTVASFFEHRIDRSNHVCDNCYLQSPPEEQEHYILKLRHYLFIGRGDPFETCIHCQVPLHTQAQ